ncbi:MAG: type II toxin-antitoxin system VapC family toxin, partial [Pseudonocardiaceae bacterium]
LADTSIWIDHLGAGDDALTQLLDQNTILAHPWVTGEIALGTLSKRTEVIGLLRALPAATVATDDEVLRLIEAESLSGRGIGYVDAQLLAATRLTPDARFWTRDKRLAQASAHLGLSFTPAPHPR